MRALTVAPGKSNSARLEDISAPAGEPGAIHLHTLAIGVCGTDVEIVRGDYGWAPPGRERMVLGHECVARVSESTGDFQRGDFVVPMVRHPDPVPCTSCAVREWDMCRNGRYTEHGIKQLDGFCAEELRLAPERLVRVAPALGPRAVLVEPTSVVAKAWEHIERIGRRAHWEPRRVLVTGAGTMGLLAALLGRQRALEVTVYDRVKEGVKPRLAKDIGAAYSSGPLPELLADQPPDIVLECTGATPVIMDVARANGAACITCLVGVSGKSHPVPVDVSALNRAMVLENDVVFGSVNANRRHYESAAKALAAAPPDWLDALVTRRVPLADWRSALERRPDDVKVVIDLGEHP